MSRIESAFRILLFTCVLAAAVPVAGYAPIEVDEEEVVFRLEDPGAAKVFLTGDFNNWNPTMDSMVERGGVWEVRLFLVPGTYRYMFVVDGESIPDPGNPNRDGDGNTFFIFVERDGVYQIVYEVTAMEEKRIEEKYSPYGSLSASSVNDYGLFTASAGMRGEIDGSLRGDMLVGVEYQTTSDDPVSAYLVRAKGEWATERARIGAFHRAGYIGFGDPLSLFTDVGPYAYPLGLFCRGAGAVVWWKDRFEGSVVFANRVDGYRSRLETREHPSLNTLVTDGNPEDRDMIGMSFEGVLKPARLNYMYRHDRGPGEQHWYCSNFWVVDGYVERTSHGLMLELQKGDYPSVSVEYLTGRTRFHAGKVLFQYPPVPDGLMSDEGIDWEDGYRALAEISWSRGSLYGMFGWHRTTIKRNPAILWWDLWNSARMDFFEAQVKYETDEWRLDLGFDLEIFDEKGGAGRAFWLQRRNFWLDGDRLRTGLLQFLDARRVWTAGLLIKETGAEQIPGPYRLEGYLSATVRWNGDGERSMFEISGGKGIRAGSFISLHTDLRYAGYRDDRWTGDIGFFAFWAGLRGMLGDSGWFASGIGVSPHRFDMWYHDFTGGGREEYLLEQGLFELVDTPAEINLIERLGKAEKSLSEEWRLSFEAGFSF